MQEGYKGVLEQVLCKLDESKREHRMQVAKVAMECKAQVKVIESMYKTYIHDMRAQLAEKLAELHSRIQRFEAASESYFEVLGKASNFNQALLNDLKTEF